MDTGVKVWPKDGEAEVVAKGWGGKALLKQNFINPDNDKLCDFTLWGVVKKNGEILLTGWSTIIMAVTEKLEVIAVRQFRHGANEITLEVPGGNPNPKFEDNSPETVGVRELAEETGYTPGRVIRLAPYAFFEPSALVPGYYPCLALDCYRTPGKKENAADEQIKVVLIPLRKYLQMMFRGEILDSKTGHLLAMSLPAILQTDAESLAQKILD